MTETTEPKDTRLVDAELIKMAAETRKLEKEIESLEVDTEIKRAEARQKIAHALSAEYGAESMRIQTEATQRQERVAKASDHNNYHYEFTDDVREESVGCCLAQLAIWHRMDENCPITITMNSPGGNVVDGLHLFDEIEKYSIRGGGTHKITMTVRGMAASMAGILVQAADKRVMGKQAIMLIHQVSAWAGGSTGEIKDTVTRLDMWNELVVDIFMTRADEVPHDQSLSRDAFVAKWERRDWWLSSKQALDYGFVDEIG